MAAVGGESQRMMTEPMSVQAPMAQPFTHPKYLQKE